MANPFDQFDAPKSAAEKNPFDQFDAPNEPEDAAMDAGVRGARQGLTFNLADEIRGLEEAGGAQPTDVHGGFGNFAKGAYKYWSGDKEAEAKYNTAVARERQTNEAAQKEHPVAYGAGEMLGAAPTMAVLPEFGATNFLTRGAIAGAEYGALSGAGEGTDATSRTEGAGVGAGLGAAAGAAGNAIGRGIEYAAGKVAEPIAQMWRGHFDPEGEAAKRLTKALQADQEAIQAGKAKGMTEQDWIAAKKAGEPVTLADLGAANTQALLRSSANVSPDARNMLEDVIQNRFENQNERTQETVRNLVAGGANAGKTADQLVADYEAQRAPHYRAAMSQPAAQSMWDETLEQVTQAPLVQNAIRMANLTAKNEAAKIGLTPMKDNPFSFDASGRMTLRDPNFTPNLQYWDAVKKNLDTMGREGQQWAKILRNHLDTIVPEYGTARGFAANFFGERDALEAGRALAGKKVDPDVIRQAMRKMDPAEQDLFREGYASDWANRVIGNISDTRDITKAMFNSPNERARALAVFGPAGMAKVDARMTLEAVMDGARKAMGNSTTARQLIENGLAGGVVSGYNLWETGSPWQAGAGFLQGAGAAHVFRPMIANSAKKVAGYVNGNVAKNVAELLTSNDPAKINKALQMAASNPKIMNGLRRVANALAQSPAGLSGNAGNAITIRPLSGAVPSAAQGNQDKGSGRGNAEPDQGAGNKAHGGSIGRARGGSVQRAIRASKGYAEGGAPDLSDDDQAAMMPETFANPYLKQTLARSLEASPPRDENVRFRTASPLVNITDEDIDRGVNIGMASGPGSIKGVGPGIRAYHGSPHDFDKFDLSKIGTGEGAQAYGHGLYFADSEGVAKSYKRPGPWSHRVDNTIDDIPASRFSPTDPVEQQAADALRRNTTVDEAVKYLQQDSGTEAAQDWLRQNAHRIKDANATGKMYEVNINADPSHFLDWDKPLSQQSQAVREKLTPEAIGLKPAGPLGDRGFYGYVDDKGRLVGRATTGRLPEEPFPGSEMASSIARGMGTWKPEEGAAALRQAGIPGIKYLDQGSRTAGAGSSNYVLFRDDIINIVKKYALAGIALPPAIAEAYDKMQNGRATGGAVSRAVRAAKGYETGGAPDYDPFAAETFLHPDLAGLSARTAQNDVGRLRDLASMEPSDRSAENIRFKTASPLVNITDEDIDRGINAGMATGPGAVRDPALWHGISSIRLPRPISEMSSVHVPTGTGKAEVIKPAALQNSRLLPLIGDRSVTGSDLTQVNGFKFADPVEMQGGHGFMAENADKDAAWASAQGVISGLAKKVRAEAGDQPIHGVYTAMGEQSADFSHHVSDTLAEMLKHTSGNRAARAAFDEAMRTGTKDFSAAEDWPGIRSKKLRQYLADSPGKIRSKFAKTMDMAPYLNAGFPSVAEARLAVTDPRLLHEPTGASGLSVAKLDPSGRTFDVAGDQHRSYDTNLAGKYVGGLPVSVPKDVMYPDIMSALNKHAQATFDRTGFRPSTDYLMARTPKGLPVTQEANQKWVDGISKYLQDRGFARGGAVMRAVLASRARS